ncbi:tetratricopeptide repeat protein [Flagellatimonas centrodinii]|uniref:tetratricopeptide repeat protein n=1 Tax=Flagellatimonas centrodinii TaxID=2806210 RepID=UPI001FEE95BA|nr:tetratricopeptide repeat protein [Flagellatimonas centrodinii]ULQ47928.1 tetratricopeptide repeat protein [Flagellatimonas centrodinii]
MPTHPIRRIAGIACLALLPLTSFAAETPQALMDRGDFAGALAVLEDQLDANPQDAEARFSRGLVLVRLGRVDDAISAFADLTRDYPQLPEPYNNLAVLYAQQGDYEQARDALEAALATHPSYATAHENLGDIYAALAGAAYNRALQLDQNNQTIRNKLSLIGQLDGGAIASARPAPTPSRPGPAATSAAAATAPVAATTAPATTATPAPAEIDAGAVEAAVSAWATAWAGQDLDAYFAAYSRNRFTPEGGLTRAAWEDQRRDRISRPEDIGVEIDNLRVEATDSGARATFTQGYRSDNFSDTVTKVLDLIREGDGWKIVREFSR